MQTKQPPKYQNGVLKIVFFYILFAALWILLSDSILSFFVKDSGLWTFFSTAKGWLFVAVTGTLLYGLITRLAVNLEHAHNELLESEKRYRFLLDMLPQFVYLKNAKGEYVTCNRTYANELGIEPTEITGKTDFDLHPAAFAEIYRQNDQRVISTGAVLEIEQPCLRNGCERVVQTVKTPVKDDQGNVIGVLGISWDITEHKQAEEAKAVLENRLRQSQKMEAIGTLAGGIAHDFNNILGVIISSAELASLDAEGVPEFQESCRNILTAATRAQELVKQILAFSRKAPVEHGPMALEKVAREAQKFIRAILPRTIEVQMDVEANLPMVLANSTQIHQIFVNLCTNAAGAMKNSHGRIDIRIQRLDTDTAFLAKHPDVAAGMYACLVVKDNGCGMDQETQRHIFDPFFTTKAPGEGTGLGLSVIHGIVRELSGYLWVDSEVGRGTEVCVLLPFSPDVATSSASQDAQPLVQGHGERILCVDDEVVLVEMLAQMLLRLGYTPITQTAPEGAIEMVASSTEKFDLVITDMTMPKMTGVELAESIKRIQPELPIILISGYSAMVSEGSLQDAGIAQTLMKPVNLHVLGEAVGKIFNQ